MCWHVYVAGGSRRKGEATVAAYTKVLVLSALVLAVVGPAGASIIIGGQTIFDGPLVIKYVNYDVGSL
jgi:hypothetical protein